MFTPVKQEVKCFSLVAIYVHRGQFRSTKLLITNILAYVVQTVSLHKHILNCQFRISVTM